uniref:Ubiquitin-like protease family profile domain-containing protein n=1 Tax=Panagrolaimus superbus TaxID=310955 RepID=A0A914YJR7_9BILA
MSSQLEEVSVPKEYYTVDLPEDYDTVCQIQLRTTTPNKQDAEIFGPCKLPYRSIKKLQKNTEIDDLIIDSYLELLADRFKALFVPVRHYKRLAESRGFDIVVKHLEADEVTDFDYLVFPCNSKCHWSGVFLNFKTKRSYLFDSGVETLSEASYANVFHCIEYVNTKLEWNFDWKEWLEIGDVGAEQKDGTSCGIYFLFNVRRAMEGTFPIHITQEQIHVFRKLILYELLSGKLYEKQMKIDQKDVVEHMHKPEQKILVDEPKDFEDVCDGLYETSAWNSKTGTSKFGKTKMAAADMKSLLPAGWITDAVIDKTAELQFEHFGRNAEIQASFLSKCG